MPTLKEVRKRIASVKSTQKITRAMKLVAAAKLRRAQDAIVAARPYSNALVEAVAQVAARAETTSHPLLERRAPRRLALVVITSDRGLCGAFNSGVCRAAQRFIVEGQEDKAIDEIRLNVAGRKGREYFKRRGFVMAHELRGATGDVVVERAKEIAAVVTDDFLAGTIDGVRLVYNQFKSAVSQKVTIEPLLPVEPAALPEGATLVDFAYEPSKVEVLDTLLPMYVRSRIYRALLESIASEFGARMTAMGNATSNAKAMIESLTLQYNRARQAAITKELMEIVGGAEALKG
jgi:F-type H+-transporting ATPase subunit gamma